MNRLSCLPALLILLAACQSTPGDDVGEDVSGGPEEPAIVLERADVQRFRGTEMVELLKKMESRDAADWAYVRRHVHPAPERPSDWNARDPDNLSDEQREWRSYLLWPEHIRVLLHRDDWDTAEIRGRLADYGRMYELLHDFQTRRPASTPGAESRYWKEFAETMLVYGEDGRNLLVSNMILSLTNPDERVVMRAQEVLRSVGPPAIEPLCAALWTTHRQLAFLTPDEGEGYYKVVANPNFNRYIVETLVLIGPRAAPQAIYELENSLDDRGQSVGTAWRYRKYFVELLGQLGPTLSGEVRGDAARTVAKEATRVKVEIYKDEASADGSRVLDPIASDDAEFVFHQHIIQALGRIGHTAGLRTVIRLWEGDEFHELEALKAIHNMTGNVNIRSLRGAKELADRLESDKDD